MAATKPKSKKTKGKKPRPKHRASWRGQLRFGLVSFPVQAFNVRLLEQGEFHFHQLHAECHSRIHYQKVCPLHGEIDNDSIVSGYEYSKGQYVEIDPDELDALRSEGERALTVDTFIAAEELDAIYYDGRRYYLTPDGASAAESYSVLAEAMRRQERDAVGLVVFSGREQLVRLRVDEGGAHHVDARLQRRDETAGSDGGRLAGKAFAQPQRSIGRDVGQSLDGQAIQFR